MATLTWQVGDVTITRILESETFLPLHALLPTADAKELQAMDWRTRDFLDESGQPKLSIHILVVQTPDRTIVVDTSVGNDKQRESPM